MLQTLFHLYSRAMIDMDLTSISTVGTSLREEMNNDDAKKLVAVVLYR